MYKILQAKIAEAMLHEVVVQELNAVEAVYSPQHTPSDYTYSMMTLRYNQLTVLDAVKRFHPDIC